MQLAPLKQEERIGTLDSLRGLALLGIFLVNMISFHSPYFYYDPYEWWKESESFWHYRWIDIFVQGSFYPLFAMMFGFGTAMQRENAMKRGQSFLPTGIRRFSFLLVIGVIHAFLIWPGDILINYAIFGLFLLLFLRLSGKILIIIGSVLLLLPNIFLSILLILLATVDPTSAVHWTDIAGIEKSIAAYGSGTFAEITQQRVADWLTGNEPSVWWAQVVSIFPHFLIGAGAQKLRIFTRGQARPDAAFITFITFFAVGVVLKSLPYMIEPNLAYVHVQDSIGGPLLAVSYAALIIGISFMKNGSKLLKPFAAAGRMSLTNYLLQSVIGTLIFYHYGLGLYGQIKLSTGVWIAVAIFVGQMILSEFWLSKFKRGPMEALWRKVTYGFQKEREQRIIKGG
ncbi:hypothetical protein AC623_03665 [Bacillus sp. FJAT-27231]|uniref:DUF418 domain-containing protein n=1 Tax=Bacillus sp. FJAT-27231 TaxID=1679168 RepID=UPI00067138E2|nr:DUF418 domain-containing protein [Bacillus sp. FJAT-27231]KMY53192.1 hypothetical protein AC623_03665 [Bacillus sp. FJAT-27231]